MTEIARPLPHGVELLGYAVAVSIVAFRAIVAYVEARRDVGRARAETARLRTLVRAWLASRGRLMAEVREYAAKVRLLTDELEAERAKWRVPQPKGRPA